MCDVRSLAAFCTEYIPFFPAMASEFFLKPFVTIPMASVIARMVTHLMFHFRSTWCVQVLRSPKEAFAAAMQSWRERCEKCVCLQGDYVEK